MPIRIMTLNIEGERHLDRVRALLDLHHPDVVCLQEVPELHCMQMAIERDY